jgi:hypothetical protein
MHSFLLYSISFSLSPLQSFYSNKTIARSLEDLRLRVWLKPVPFDLQKNKYELQISPVCLNSVDDLKVGKQNACTGWVDSPAMHKCRRSCRYGKAFSCV